MAKTLRQTAIAAASYFGKSRIDGVLHFRALVDAGLAPPGRRGSFGGNKSPPATPEQVALLALSLANGALPKEATREAAEFYGLPLVSGYRAFQNDVGIQSASIGDIEVGQGASFGDVLSQVIASY